jgi:hypothetical protein
MVTPMLLASPASIRPCMGDVPSPPYKYVQYDICDVHMCLVEIEWDFESNARVKGKSCVIES